MVTNRPKKHVSAPQSASPAHEMQQPPPEKCIVTPPKHIYPSQNPSRHPKTRYWPPKAHRPPKFIPCASSVPRPTTHQPPPIFYPSPPAPPLCRNLENIQADKPPGFIPEVLKLLRVCASKVGARGEPPFGGGWFIGVSARGGFFGGAGGGSSRFSWQLKSPEVGERSRMQLESGMLHALHLCESLFDPYQTWRRELSG